MHNDQGIFYLFRILKYVFFFTICVFAFISIHLICGSVLEHPNTICSKVKVCPIAVNMLKCLRR